MPEIRRLDVADLKALTGLQEIAYEPHRRSSRWSVRRSLTSPAQEVWGIGMPLQAAMILWTFSKTVRLYDVAVHPSQQGKGLGRALVEFASKRAGTRRLVLESDAAHRRYYEALGFRVVAAKPDFYGPGLDAVRMVRQ